MLFQLLLALGLIYFGLNVLLGRLAWAVAYLAYLLARAAYAHPRPRLPRAALSDPEPPPLSAAVE